MTACVLCTQRLPAYPISEGSLQFCCAGCHAVYTILASKQQLDNYRDHPVFKQALSAGLISNPHLIEELRRSKAQLPEGEWEKLYLEIGDMWCPSCAEVIRLILLQEKGVKECVVDYATDLASLTFSPRLLAKERILEKITSLGYRPTSLQDGVQKAVSKDLTLRFIIAAFCALNVMMFAYPLYSTYFDADEEGVGPLFAWISALVSLPVVTYCAGPILRRCYNGLLVGVWGMEALVVLGVFAACALSTVELLSGGTRVYFDSMTVVIAFVLLGRIIESKAKFSAKETLLRLMRSLPRRGRKRFSDGSERFMPIKDIVPGDLLVACTGEKIVLDGVVVEGEGSCNEALMTGEALPVAKKPGTRLLGGSHLSQGWLLYRVATTLGESALQNIIASVEQEIGNKAQFTRPVDKIVRWFVPLVLCLAIATAVICLAFESAETAVLRAVAVLLISCPCAIGIAAPLAEAHLMNRLAKMGVIVRNRAALEWLGRETRFAFDKTGTITKGEFCVLDGLERLFPTHKEILKSLTLRSIHPVAVALSKALDIEPAILDNVEEIIGNGMRARLGPHLYELGSPQFIGAAPPAHTSQCVTHLYFACNKQILAQIVLGDSVREAVPALVAQLPKPFLLSGDGQTAVAAVAQQCHFKAYKWGVNPLQKREWILQERAKGEIVCMVGDGINDAPALTAAHIGISVVTAADISIHVSDLLLTTDNLEIIPEMRTLARKGRRIVKQNLFWAFFYNVVGIGFAAVGALSPLFAAGAMVASSLIVTLNAQRLK